MDFNSYVAPAQAYPFFLPQTGSHYTSHDEQQYDPLVSNENTRCSCPMLNLTGDFPGCFQRPKQPSILRTERRHPIPAVRHRPSTSVTPTFNTPTVNITYTPS